MADQISKGNLQVPEIAVKGSDEIVIQNQQFPQILKVMP
jgi:hypothetical protein